MKCPCCEVTMERGGQKEYFTISNLVGQLRGATRYFCFNSKCVSGVWSSVAILDEHEYSEKLSYSQRIVAYELPYVNNKMIYVLTGHYNAFSFLKTLDSNYNYGNKIYNGKFYSIESEDENFHLEAKKLVQRITKLMVFS